MKNTESIPIKNKMWFHQIMHHLKLITDCCNGKENPSSLLHTKYLTQTFLFWSKLGFLPLALYGTYCRLSVSKQKKIFLEVQYLQLQAHVFSGDFNRQNNKYPSELSVAGQSPQQV